MTYPDLKKYAQEMEEMERLPPAAIELPPLAALAIISHIQLASRHPSVMMSPFTKIAIDTARQLQNLFNPESATYQVIELGWDANEDIPKDFTDTSIEELEIRNSLAVRQLLLESGLIRYRD